MPQDSRDVLQILRYELNYLEQGGFDRDRALLGTESPFLGTFSCINYGDPLRSHACHECTLHQFVPDDKKTEEIPCHFIRLNPSGETIAKLLEKNDAARMKAALENWLRATISRMESTLNRDSK
jgi:hypothetical protein